MEAVVQGTGDLALDPEGKNKQNDDREQKSDHGSIFRRLNIKDASE
jgi:hypothetical protein